MERLLKDEQIDCTQSDRKGAMLKWLERSPSEQEDQGKN